MADLKHRTRGRGAGALGEPAYIAISFSLHTMASSDAQRQALIASLRERYAKALQREDAEAKQALFKEAVYLGIQPDLFTQNEQP
jgi:hypothetical protein